MHNSDPIPHAAPHKHHKQATSKHVTNLPLSLSFSLLPFSFDQDLSSTPPAIPPSLYRRLDNFREYTNLLMAAENRCNNSSSPGNASVSIFPSASSLKILMEFV